MTEALRLAASRRPKLHEDGCLSLEVCRGVGTAAGLDSECKRPRLHGTMCPGNNLPAAWAKHLIILFT